MDVTVQRNVPSLLLDLLAELVLAARRAHRLRPNRLDAVGLMDTILTDTLTSFYQ